MVDAGSSRFTRRMVRLPPSRGERGEGERQPVQSVARVTGETSEPVHPQRQLRDLRCGSLDGDNRTTSTDAE
eukprot:scaffold478_cov409-Prasinococcus_capsulatus_cf.AAC.2